MKGGSREVKGHKSTGGGRTWYGKRKTLVPLSPPTPPPLPLSRSNKEGTFFFLFATNNVHRARK